MARRFSCFDEVRAERIVVLPAVIPLLRSFTVFNAAQVDGLPEALAGAPAPAADWSPVEVLYVVRFGLESRPFATARKPKS